MEKLQMVRKRKPGTENPRMDPLMRALKALHSAGSPENMTPEELEHQRRNQELLGRLWREWIMRRFPLAGCLPRGHG